MLDFGSFIDASVFTRAESVTRLGFGPRFERPSNWGQNGVDNTGCLPYRY